MTLKTGDNRCTNPYKTGFLSCPSLILQSLTRGSNLVNTGHLIIRVWSKVITDPPKTLSFFTDSTFIVGLKITQIPISPTTIGVTGFLSMLYHLLLSALVYIGVFLNHMHLKSAISSRTQARYLANIHFFNSRQVIFIPGAVSPHRHYLEEQELISCHGPYPFDPSMMGSVPNKLVSWLQNWEMVLLITEESIV